MYFPSRKLLLTASLVALATLAGCSSSRVRLQCPSYLKTFGSSTEHSEPAPATEHLPPHESTAPVPPDVPANSAPGPDEIAPGPTLPEKPISAPRALPQAASEVPEFNDDETSPGDSAHFGTTPPEKLPLAPSPDTSGAVEAEVPKDRQSSQVDPSLMDRVRGRIPRVEVRDVPDQRPAPAKLTATKSSTPMPAAAAPQPDPISMRPQRRPHAQQQTLSPTILEYNHNYPYSSGPVEMKAIPSQPPDHTAVVPEPTPAFEEETDADFEFNFATPTSAVVEPEPWPFRQASHE